VNYTTSADIALYLGVTFTPEQQAAADAVATAVTLYIDRYVGRSWQATSPVSGEAHAIVPPVPGDRGRPARVFLAHVPAVAVTAVTIRGSAPAATETVLTADQFELLDPEHGVVTLVTWWSPWYPDQLPVAPWLAPPYGDALALVDYTFGAAVPADVALAAQMIGAAEMARQIAVQSSSASVAAHPELAGLSSIAVGRNDLAITRTDTSAATVGGAAAGAELAPVGSTARTILDSYRRVVLA